MVDFLASLGSHLGKVEGFEFHEFPSLERLSLVSEVELRNAGFGYRSAPLSSLLFSYRRSLKQLS